MSLFRDNSRTYQSLLREIYDARKARNPSYSLAAFSRDAGFRSYHISDIIAGRYGLSPRMALRVAERLKMPDHLRQEFVLLVESTTAKNEIDRQRAKEKLAIFSYHADELSPAEFGVFDEWYYFAIIEVVRKYSGKNCTAKVIADELGLTEIQAADALSALKRAKILEPLDNGDCAVAVDHLAVRSAVPSKSIRKYHRQVLARASDAIDGVDISERFFTNFNVCMRGDEYSNFIGEVTAFIRQKIYSIQQNQRLPEDRIYSIGINFIPLNKKNETR